MKKLFFGLKAMLVAVRQTVQVYRKVLAGYWCRKDDERDSGDAQLAIDRIVAQTDILRSALQAVILHGRPVILITDQGERIGYAAVSFSRGAEGVIQWWRDGKPSVACCNCGETIRRVERSEEA